MDGSGFSVVTGAFGNTGRYIAGALLAAGEQVRTLTDHPHRPNPFDDRISAAPFNFDEPTALAESLRGARTLYNTYWARFSHGNMTYDKAVRNTGILIDAAREAGVEKIVQLTVTHASEDSPIPYFKAKGQVETAVMASGLSYCIIRPSAIFGPGCILINNIAWLLRHFPVFAVPGKGDYKIGPVHVEDVAGLAVRMGSETANRVVDSVGPETFTFDELVREIARSINSNAIIAHLPPGPALLLAWMAGKLVRDIILERWEIDAIMAGLMCSDGPPTGRVRLRDWMRENSATLGVRYQSELARHYKG